MERVTAEAPPDRHHPPVAERDEIPAPAAPGSPRKEHFMNRQAHLATWDMMRLRHGITLRVIEQIPEDQLTRNPVAGMRTPVELLVHMYAGIESLADSVLTGKCESPDEKTAVAAIRSRAQLLDYVKQKWASGDAKAKAATDAQLSGMVSTPWGDPFPGAAMIGFIHDEYLHHRGQLYAFVRTYGIEPVMVWDFDHSAPEFRPAQHAKS
jgi:uncharacterized damage-inducible protein DinB